MNLVTHAPEKSGVVPCAMPPVEDECPGKPTEQTFEYWIVNSPALEKRYAVQPTVPGDAGEENDSDLTSVEKSCAQIPTGGFRKLAAGGRSVPKQRKRRSFRQSESREDSCWPPLRLKIRSVLNG